MTENSKGLASVQLLLVEVSPGDVRLTLEALRYANTAVTLHVPIDGVEAKAFLRQEDIHVDVPRTDLILLHLNLPRMDGREVLALFKDDDTLKTIPTVVLTTSQADADIVKSSKLHANCYRTNPVAFTESEGLVQSINECWLQRPRLPQQPTTNE